MISREVLLQELETSRTIIDKWIEQVKEGIPGIDTPVSGDQGPERFENFIRSLCSELRIVSGKCDTLAEVAIEVLLQG